MTVVGGNRNGHRPWAPAGWDDIHALLEPQRPTRLVELTVSDRTPAEVVALAAQVLAVAAPDIAPRPVPPIGFPPRIVATSRWGSAHTAELARESRAVRRAGWPSSARMVMLRGIDPGPRRGRPQPDRSTRPRGRPSGRWLVVLRPMRRTASSSTR